MRFHRQATRKTTANVNDLFQEIFLLFQGRFAGSGILASADTESLSSLFCYEGELKQILTNLVSNSFDAMRHGGKLLLRSRTVTAWPSGKQALRITVADDGTGFSPEACRHLFEPFFSTKGINGAGLGLWISKDLVDRNGGRIRVRSKATAALHGTVIIMLFIKPPNEELARSRESAGVLS